jgi:hypothetical protein
MPKPHLYVTGITASFAILLATAAAQDAELPRQARELFQPLPKNMATQEFPVTNERTCSTRAVAVLRSPADHRWQHQLLDLSSTSALWNRLARQIYRCRATSASSSRPNDPQCSDEFCHSLAWRPRERRRPSDKGHDLAHHLRPARREGCGRPCGGHRGLCPAVRGSIQMNRNR